MLKVIAIADCHIKMVPGVCKGFQTGRYRKFIDHIVSECVKEDAILVIAGDTLDSTSAKKEELKLFMYFLHQLNSNKINTLLVSGNHESIKKGESILDFLEVDKFEYVHYRTVFEDPFEDVAFHLVNHDELNGYQHVHTRMRTNILVSHFRCNYTQFVTEEINVAEFTKPYDMCIVGDIHAEHITGNVVYTNNPVNKEFDTNPKTGYLKLTIDNGNISWERCETDVPKLVGIKLKADDMNGVNLDSKNFYRIEVEGTTQELKALPDSLPNALIVKVPIVESLVAMPKEVEEITGASCGEDDLISYMHSLNFTDDRISSMMAELRRGHEG